MISMSQAFLGECPLICRQGVYARLDQRFADHLEGGRHFG
jgi:hypothetical protein